MCNIVSRVSRDAGHIRFIWCVLIHSRPRVQLILVGCCVVLHYSSSKMDEKFYELMREIRQSRHEVEEKIADLKMEVNSVQQKTSQDLAKKIGNSSYQFKRKGNKHQYHFNSTIEEAMCSAKDELGKLKSTAQDEKAALKRAEKKLAEGTKALTEWQKHIKVADRSKFGWATVNYYRDDPLALDSEDEKSLNQAKKRQEGR